MIFFADNNGTIIKSLPSPVYQGGANTNNIYLIAPFASLLPATVRFKLPNGVWTKPQLMGAGNTMTVQGPVEGVIEKSTGQTYSVWTYALPNNITEYYGTVKAQFFFYGAQNGSITPTSETSFIVQAGVPEVLPDTPTQDIYNQILSQLSLLQTQLNNGGTTARSIYSWQSVYTYGAGELVFYPDEGEYGVFVKSLVANNKTEPYTDGVLNSQNWQLITDFNVLTELYDLKEDIAQSADTAQKNAQAAQQSMTAAAASASAAAQSMTSAESAAELAVSSAESIKDSADYLAGVKSGTVSVPSATTAANDTSGNNIASQFSSVESDIQGLREDFTNESHFRGYLSTNAEIQALSGTPNDYAYSAESGTIWIYQTATGWTNSGKPVPDQTVAKGTTLPLMDGTAQVGDSNTYADAQHRHPSDANKVNKAGDTMTGTLEVKTTSYTAQLYGAGIEFEPANKLTKTIYSDGVINFCPNRSLSEAGYLIALPSNGGTLALQNGTYSDMTVGSATKADKLDVGGSMGVVGDSETPVYFSGGKPVTANKMPKVTLNGSSTNTPSFYAPTSAGTAGQVLTSTGGMGGPVWKDASSGGSTLYRHDVYIQTSGGPGAVTLYFNIYSQNPSSTTGSLSALSSLIGNVGLSTGGYRYISATGYSADNQIIVAITGKSYYNGTLSLTLEFTSSGTTSITVPSSFSDVVTS